MRCMTPRIFEIVVQARPPGSWSDFSHRWTSSGRMSSATSCPPEPEGIGPRFCGAVGSLPPILVFWPRPHSCLGLTHLLISPWVYPRLRRKLTRTILRTFPPGCSSLRLPCLGSVSALGSLQISQSVRPPARFRRSLCVVVPDLEFQSGRSRPIRCRLANLDRVSGTDDGHSACPRDGGTRFRRL